MAFALVASTETNSINSATADTTRPSGTADGDILFTLFMTDSNGGYATTIPTGWNRLGQFTDGNSDKYELYYKIAASEPATWTWGWPESKARFIVIGYRGGFDSADPIDVVSNTEYATNNTTLRAASMTVSAANSPLIFAGGRFSTAAVTFTKPSVPTTDWVEDVDSGSTSPDLWQTVCHMTWTGSGATGDMDATMDVGTSIAKHAFAVALNPQTAATTKHLQLLGIGK